MAALFYDSQTKRLGPLLRGHLLWYERREGPSYTARAGLCLLLLFVVLEFLVGPRMEGIAALGLQPPSSILRTLILLAALLTGAKLVGVRWADIGFTPFNKWRAAEWVYLAQAFVVAGAVFAVLFGARLHFSAAAPAAWIALGGFVFSQMLWGLYQEAVYRGLLQTELARRFGAPAGVLIANIAFTFGPLHLYHLRHIHDPVATAILMGSTFLIGLVFAFIFARARNVWLIGLLHGLGDTFGNVGHLGL